MGDSFFESLVGLSFGPLLCGWELPFFVMFPGRGQAGLTLTLTLSYIQRTASTYNELAVSS